MNIGFIGAGNLGEKAIIRLSDKYDVFVSDPVEKDFLKDKTKGYFSFEKTINFCDLIFLTIKPNKLEELFQNLDLDTSSKVFISFIAGQSLNKMENLIGKENKIARGMPTVGIGTGDSSIAITANFDLAEEETTKKILNELGSTFEIEENKFDAFTAIVGAGPAYFALLAETLSEIAIKEGFDKPFDWINTLMLGTSKIYDEKKDIGFEEIMTMVASKGGVTEKALENMQENGLKKIISDAIQMAITKSKELGN